MQTVSKIDSQTKPASYGKTFVISMPPISMIFEKKNDVKSFDVTSFIP